MKQSQFRRNFPPSYEIPEAIWKLFQYQINASGYSGYFCLDDTLWSIEFPDALRPYFVLFGSDADGSFYAFWLYSDFSLKNAPIVFLSFDGTKNIILANSFLDFLALLGLGIEELGYTVQQSNWWKTSPKSNDANTEFRQWLKYEFDIVPPEDPWMILQDARNNHPDLNQWLKERMNSGK